MDWSLGPPSPAAWGVAWACIRRMRARACLKRCCSGGVPAPGCGARGRGALGVRPGPWGSAPFHAPPSSRIPAGPDWQRAAAGGAAPDGGRAALVPRGGGGGGSGSRGRGRVAPPWPGLAWPGGGGADLTIRPPGRPAGGGSSSGGGGVRRFGGGPPLAAPEVRRRRSRHPLVRCASVSRGHEEPICSGLQLCAYQRRFYHLPALLAPGGGARGAAQQEGAAQAM